MSSRDRVVTLRDVAAAAGTTAMTVSNVVNGRAGQVGSELRRRVLDACADLGYRPHASARRLRTNRRMAIGVIIVDPSPYYVSDPLTAAMLAGLNARLGAAGYSTVLHGVPPAALGSVTVLKHIESDGVVLVLSGTPQERHAIIERVTALGQPVVLVQDDALESVADVAAVRQDDEGAARALAEHLFTGRERSAVMLVPAVPWAAMARREAGVRAHLSTLREPPRLHVVPCGDEGFAATQAALATHVAAHGVPDILIGGNDQMAIAGMKYLVTRGIPVPQDVRACGFNGLEFWRYATPELTTAFSPAYELGETAADALLERLVSGAFPFRQRVLPVTIHLARSSEVN